jgi:hypothetical protein
MGPRERCRAVPHLTHARRCGSAMAMTQEPCRRRIERGSRGQQRQHKDLAHHRGAFQSDRSVALLQNIETKKFSQMVADFLTRKS